MKKTLLFAPILFGATLLSLSSCEKPVDPIPLPIAPSEIVIIADSTKLSLTWKADPNSETYVAELRDAAQKITSKNTVEPAVVFDGLESQTEYEVRVGTLNKGAETKYSEWQKTATLAGKIAKQFALGSGTQADPYVIMTASQLALLAKLTNEEAVGYVGMGVYYQLGANIDLGGQKWEPIGNGLQTDFEQPVTTPKPAFNSRFDGKNFTISNLLVQNDRNDKLHLWAGLFGANRGNIANINVTGVVSAINSIADPNAAVMAGGICGHNSIVIDGMEPESGTGMILGSSFEGSVESSTAASGAAAMSGGVVGIIVSGNVDNCKAKIPIGGQVVAKGFGSISAGGICGFLSAGRIDADEVIIDGIVLAKINSLGDDEQLASAHAGGVCGSMQTSTLTPDNFGFGSCSAVINGSVEARVDDGITAAVVTSAGGLAGSVLDTMCGECKVENNGKIISVGTSATYVGGMIANLNDGRVVVGEVVNNGLMSAKTTGADNQFVTYLGGIVGSSGARVSVSQCKFINNAEMVSDAGSAGFTGGISGSGGSHVLNSVLFTKSSSVKLTAVKDVAFGGVVANGGASAITVCSTVIDGKFTASTPTMLLYGGLAGNFAPMTNRICRSSCAVVLSDVVVEGSPAKTSIGALYGRTSAKGISNNCHWWSGASLITQADGSNPSKSGAIAIASYDEAGFMAAETALNEDVAVIDPPLSLRYKYDSALGYLELK